MKHLKLILLSITLLSCATTQDPFSNNRDLFYRMLKNNDTQGLKVYLEKNSFSGVSFSLKPKFIVKTNAYNLLDVAISGRTRSQNIVPYNECRTKFVQLMLENGLNPRARDLLNASKKPCVDMAKVILSHLKKDELSAGINDILKMLETEKYNLSNLPARLKLYQELYLALNQYSSEETFASLSEIHALLNKVNNESLTKQRMQSVKEKYLQSVEKKFNLPFCREANLFNAIFYNQVIKNDCIYSLKGPLVIFQKAQGGILVHLNPSVTQFQDQIFFIKTDKEYFDGQALNPILVKENGAFSYTTVLGVKKHIRAFKLLQNL